MTDSTNAAQSASGGTATAEASRAGGAFGPSGWGDYPRLWLATALSALGNGVRMTALPLLALSYTTDPTLISLVTAAGTAPLLLSPLAGVAADRWARRGLLIRVDLARFVLVALLAVAVLTGVADLWILCAAALLLGVGESFFVVTSQTFLPEVVDAGRLSAANGRLQVAQLVFQDTLGQPLGGVLFAALAALPLLLDSATFLLGVLLLVTVSSVARTAPSNAAARQKWSASVAEGMRYLKGDRLLLVLAGMLGVLNFFVVGTFAVLVVYVVHTLGLKESAFGLFLTAGALGGVAAGFLAPRLGRLAGTFPSALGALAASGAACLLLGLTRQTVLAALAFLVLNFGTVVYQVVTVSFRQQAAPPELLGRINGAYRLIGLGPAPVGAAVAGVVAERLGAGGPFLVSGIALLVLVAVVTGPLLRMSAGRLPAA